MYTDLGLTEDGDLILDDGEFTVVQQFEFYKQCATNRIKSIKKDWYKDNIGADLEEILGMPNTRVVASLGENKIRQSLTFDNLFNDKDIVIVPSPVTNMIISYSITIQSEDFGGPIKLEVTLDLTQGIKIGG